MSSAVKMKHECFDFGKGCKPNKMKLVKINVDETHTKKKAMTNMLMKKQLVKQTVDKDIANTMKANIKKPTFEFTRKKKY